MYEQICALCGNSKTYHWTFCGLVLTHIYLSVSHTDAQCIHSLSQLAELIV